MRSHSVAETVIEEARLLSGKTKEEVAIATVGNTATWARRMNDPKGFRYEETNRLFDYLGMNKEQRQRFAEAVRELG